MMNMILWKYRGKLASPFMLVHGVCPDQWTWILLFSHCCFHHEKDSNTTCSKSQAHTMNGILLGFSPISNAVLMYNPWNQNYYEPDSYSLNPYWLPSSVYPTIRYNGGLFVSLHQDDAAVISKLYPPWARVEELNSTLELTRAGTVMDILFDLSSSPQYLIIFDNGTTCSVLSQDMPALIPTQVTSVLDTSHLLPQFLDICSKIMFKHESQFHKGFLSKTPDGMYCFSCKSHITKSMRTGKSTLPI